MTFCSFVMYPLKPSAHMLGISFRNRMQKTLSKQHYLQLENVLFSRETSDTSEISQILTEELFCGSSSALVQSPWDSCYDATAVHDVLWATNSSKTSKFSKQKSSFFRGNSVSPWFSLLFSGPEDILILLKSSRLLKSECDHRAPGNQALSLHSFLLMLNP